MKELSSPHLSFWAEAREHLSRVEPPLVPILEKFSAESLSGNGDAFQTLANAIVGQQLSVKAASTIWGRLGTLLGSVTPQTAASASFEGLRSVGLSSRKAEYVQGLAKAFLEGTVNPEVWNHQDDETVMKSLVSLRGIGRWTAEMFLIFHLHRPDVLPLGDVGLLRAAGLILGGGSSLSAPELEARAEAWKPWRTVATWYLWRALDPEPVVY